MVSDLTSLSKVKCGWITYVVVEVGVGDGNPISSVGDVEEAVKVVLASAQVSGKVAVVDPDIGGLVDSDGITVFGKDLGNLEVAEDDVALTADVESHAGDGYERSGSRKHHSLPHGKHTATSGTNNGLVRGRADTVAAAQLAGHDDGKGTVTLSSLDQGSNSGDSDGRASSTASSASVLGAVAYGASLGSLTLKNGIRGVDGRTNDQGGEEGDEDGGKLHGEEMRVIAGLGDDKLMNKEANEGKVNGG